MKGGRSTAAFYALTISGLASGAGLWVYTIVDRPTIVLDSIRVVEEGGSARVQSMAKNESDETAYCIVVEMSAIDIDGYTLASATATSNAGSRLGPRQTANFVARFEGLTERQRAEQLDDYIAYVVDQQPC